jgi:membrane-bound lytic murein transglycosylase MltF
MINKYDPIIQKITGDVWPELDWKIIKHQINQESAFNPQAVSKCGARGLLQLMPATARELGVSALDQLFDPQTNLMAGITYLKRQYMALKEISDRDERIKFALASYNGGRGYINAAIKLATMAAKAKGEPAVLTWAIVSKYLSNPDCKCNGKRSDHKQITDYVRRIWSSYTTDNAKRAGVGKLNQQEKNKAAFIKSAPVHDEPKSKVKPSSTTIKSMK